MSVNRIMLGVQTLGAAYAMVFTLIVGGDGSAQQRHFEVSDFERLHIEGAVAVVLEQASTTRGDATGTTASLAALAVEASDGTLYIVAGEDAHADNLTLRLTVGELQEIVGAGAPYVYGTGLTQHELTLEGHGAGVFALEDIRVEELFINGAGNTRFAVSGSARHQVVDMMGVSRYAASGLSSETSYIEVRGASEVEVWTDDLLEVMITGAAKVSYLGEPWVRQRVVGTGLISRI